MQESVMKSLNFMVKTFHGEEMEEIEMVKCPSCGWVHFVCDDGDGFDACFRCSRPAKLMVAASHEIDLLGVRCSLLTEIILVMRYVRRFAQLLDNDTWKAYT